MTSEEPAETSNFWPYVLPLAGFLALTGLESYLPSSAAGGPSPVWYPLGYVLKIVIVSALLWFCRSTWSDLAPWPSNTALALSIATGLLVTALWVGLDGSYPEIAVLGKRVAFDPSTMPPVARAGFLFLRMFGLVVVVPLVEEIFYRAFLMRWIVDPDFTKVPIGKVTSAGLAVTTGVFAFSHPEWLPALLTGLAWGWLLWRTKSVSACVVSHATANLALGIYVLVTHEWKYW